MSVPPSPALQTPTVRHWSIVLVILVIACVVRLGGVVSPVLWSDEVYSATFGSLAPIEALRAGLRYDLHPPLYYFQLSLWGLIDAGDRWLHANSVLFSVGAVLVVALSGRGRGRELECRALVAAAVLALTPEHVHYAASLRMYALLGFLVTLLWRQMEALESGPWTPVQRLWVLFIVVWIGYSHVLGFFTVAMVSLYGLLVLRSRKPDSREWRQHLMTAAAIAVALLPAVGNALARSASHVIVPEAARMSLDWSTLVVGHELAKSTAGLAISACALALATVGALRHRRVRRMMICFVVAPTVVLVITSHLYEPIWNRRLIVPVMPMFAVILADSLWAIFPRNIRLRTALGAVVVACLGVGLFAYTNDEKEQDYQKVAASIEASIPAGSTVFAPSFVDFWGLLRYLDGPRWGSPLDVQPNEPNESWARVVDGLPASIGAEVSGVLALDGSKHRLVAAGYDLCIGPEFAPDPGSPPTHMVRRQSFKRPIPSVDGWTFTRLSALRGIEIYSVEHLPGAAFPARGSRGDSATGTAGH